MDKRLQETKRMIYADPSNAMAWGQWLAMTIRIDGAKLRTFDLTPSRLLGKKDKQASFAKSLRRVNDLSKYRLAVDHLLNSKKAVVLKQVLAMILADTTSNEEFSDIFKRHRSLFEQLKEKSEKNFRVKYRTQIRWIFNRAKKLSLV